MQKEQLATMIYKLIPAQWETFLFYIEDSISSELMPSNKLNRKEQVNQLMNISALNTETIEDCLKATAPHMFN